MEKMMTVSFPGGKKVNANYKGGTIRTDQPIKEGGEGSAPEPFTLFFASIATCAGIYALEFCNERHISTDGLALRLKAIRNPTSKLFDQVVLTLTLPANFPKKYRKVITKAVNLCTVKKHIVDPPQFRLEIN